MQWLALAQLTRPPARIVTGSFIAANVPHTELELNIGDSDFLGLQQAPTVGDDPRSFGFPVANYTPVRNDD